MKTEQSFDHFVCVIPRELLLLCLMAYRKREE